MEEREKKALESGAKDDDVECQKKTYENCGNFLGGLTLIVGASSYQSIEGELFTAGLVSQSAAFYIMRTDYLPPRKDCVRRGLDKLAEKLSEIKIPSPLPPPVPQLTSYKTI